LRASILFLILFFSLLFTFPGSLTAKGEALETRLVKVEGEILSSLARAIRTAGETSSLTNAIVDVLAWQMDFSRDARKGDRFKVLVEKRYKGDQFIRYGTIQGLEYQGRNRVIRAIRYQGKYYNENGESLGKPFLKVPLRYDYVSSGFTQERKHPIMGGTLPHLGVDYAAPTGTPVWAIADGIVTFRGWVEGFGKQVVLRHPNGYMSYYSHFSRYGPGIKVGVRVKQKQVIGYVGSTGFSTGPHLDFRITRDGKFLDPLKKENFPSGQPIGKNDKEPFQKRREEVMAWLKDGPCLE
jgi:murein DD-endopeptidase MepM/ murein hydrolase activator NlpD